MLELRCQQSALNELSKLAGVQRRSVLITGQSGSGKTFLAQEYGRLCNVSTVAIVSPTVKEIRDAIDTTQITDSPVLLCIENLDKGVPGASYTLLKALEEPRPNVTIVVTVSNIKKVPDTIISRSSLVTIGSVSQDDIAVYAVGLDKSKFESLSALRIWRCVRSFKDVDMLFGLDGSKLDYYTNGISDIISKGTVQDMSWNLSRYPDNSECAVEFVIRCIMDMNFQNTYIRKACIDALKAIGAGRISKHAILAKLSFELKYGA